MPVLNSIALQQTEAGATVSHAVLVQNGPFIQTEISVPKALAELLTSQKEPVPVPIAGAALIDTGASRSCIDITVAQQLGLQPISAIPIGIADSATLIGTYPAHFRFPLLAGFDTEFSSVVGANLSKQNIEGMRLIALIGRDFLARCLLVYNGPMGSYSLSI